MDTFNPVRYSPEERAFLLENVGKPPVLVEAFPAGVNPRAVRPILQEAYDRETLRKERGIPWVGAEAIRESIRVFEREDRKWEDAWKRGHGRVPRYPSMYTKDYKGKFMASGPGSDNILPRSWLDAEGNRHYFEVNLDGTDPRIDEPVRPGPERLIDEVENHRITCPICKHTESYREDSASSHNAARARMSRHLKKPDNEVSLHRELYTKEFLS